jgi:hypothetical protein
MLSVAVLSIPATASCTRGAREMKRAVHLSNQFGVPGLPSLYNSHDHGDDVVRVVDANLSTHEALRKVAAVRLCETPEGGGPPSRRVVKRTNQRGSADSRRDPSSVFDAEQPMARMD